MKIVDSENYDVIIPYQIEGGFDNKDIGLKFAEGTETVNSVIVEMDTFLEYVADFFFGVLDNNKDMDSRLSNHIKQSKTYEFIP